MQKTLKNKKNENTAVGNVHFVGLYCKIMLQCMVQKTKFGNCVSGKVAQ